MEPEKHLINRKNNSVQITNTAQHSIYRFLHNNTKRIYQTFKNIVYEFLWKGKKDPVKRSVLSNDYLEGGLKMTNIDTGNPCFQ
jgi:hypothetical protein